MKEKQKMVKTTHMANCLSVKYLFISDAIYLFSKSQSPANHIRENHKLIVFDVLTSTYEKKVQGVPQNS